VLKLIGTLTGIALSSLIFAGCDASNSENKMTEITYHNMPGTEDLGLPFSSAVQVDNTLYMSGNLGNLPGKLELVPGGIEAETRQTMENIKVVAEQFGSSMDRVVKCTVFLADMDEWGAMNEIYRTYFKNPPARSAFGTNGLALDARVEIECIAIVK
jgi:2-iminobutanoate/2-iminopropanoate deaminase